MTTQRTLRHGESGIALVSAMLILVLAMVFSATFMMSVVNERSLSSSVHGSRATVLAADAGVRTMQQMITNAARTKLDSLTAAWSGSGPIITNPATAFNGTSFTFASTDPPFNAVATIAFLDTSINAAQQTFDYQWTIQSTSDGPVGARRQVQSTGTIRLSASRGSFTDYLVYTNQHTSPSGGAIWFTSRTSFDGRVHSNGKLRFAYQPTFQDLVTSVSPVASYLNDPDSEVDLNDDHNGTRDVPNFNGGFQRGAPNVALPGNAFSQMNAAIGLDPTLTTAPDNMTLNSQLGLGASATAPSNGIYLGSTGGITNGSNITGGIYVRGNLDDCLLSIDGSGNQVYTLSQGSTTLKFTVNRLTNTTAVYDGSTTKTLNGTPRGMLFVTGSISNLRGPDRVSGAVVPAVARDTKLLITAQADISVSRDIVCKDYADGTNVLGLYASNGSVRVSTSAPDDMNLDAFVMATGSSGQFKVDNYDQNDPRGTFHLRGGMITEYYGAFGQFSGTTPTHGYGRDFMYDRRGVVPPYFPTTNRFVSNVPTSVRQTWQEI